MNTVTAVITIAVIRTKKRIPRIIPATASEERPSSFPVGVALDGDMVVVDTDPSTKGRN